MGSQDRAVLAELNDLGHLAAHIYRICNIARTKISRDTYPT